MFIFKVWIMIVFAYCIKHYRFILDGLPELIQRLCMSAKSNKQVLYVLLIPSILGKLLVVHKGDTGTISFSMRRESADFDGASCDSKPGEGDGCGWWYIN
jgi:hypothetical protein